MFRSLLLKIEMKSSTNVKIQKIKMKRNSDLYYFTIDKWHKFAIGILAGSRGNIVSTALSPGDISVDTMFPLLRAKMPMANLMLCALILGYKGFIYLRKWKKWKLLVKSHKIKNRCLASFPLIATSSIVDFIVSIDT